MTEKQIIEAFMAAYMESIKLEPMRGETPLQALGTAVAKGLAAALMAANREGRG